MSSKSSARPFSRLLGKFIREYLMVVLGVLTALAMGQWLVHVRQHQDATTASKRIEAEIRTNIDAIHHARKVDAEHWKSLDGIRGQVIRRLRTHVPDATIEKYILAHTQAFGLDMRWPQLHHQAWDMAVANQSVGWIDDERLRRYAAAYAAINDIDAMQRENVGIILNGSHMSETMVNLKIGQLDPHAFLYTVNRMANVLHDTVNMLGLLENRLDKTLARKREASEEK